MYNFASLYCQAVFRNIADTYGIFSEGTMRRVIKETLHTNKRGKTTTSNVGRHFAYTTGKHTSQM